MNILFRYILLALCICSTADVFAATKITSETLLDESTIIGYDNTGLLSADETDKEDVNEKQETKKELHEKQEIGIEVNKKEQDEKRKEQEKTINDINTFLIESYKLKIDRILANLNLSIERITNNNAPAQAKLLEKIRGDIDVKIQVINSRNISDNRRKILSSVFSYIQENLDSKISKLVGQK
ncbi:MAG: hypothetical protein PHQ95_04005 [Candidatus Gracilibacteria bacterium]|nr:hypothetical protein [Candidatus Gracilibacteria bacterium]